MRSLLTIAVLTIVSLTISAYSVCAAEVPDISIRTKPYKILLKAAMLLPARARSQSSPRRKTSCSRTPRMATSTRCT